MNKETESSSVVSELFRNFESLWKEIQQKNKITNLTDDEAKKQAIDKIRKRAATSEAKSTEKSNSEGFATRLSGKQMRELKHNEEMSARKRVYVKEDLDKAIEITQTINRLEPNAVPDYVVGSGIHIDSLQNPAVAEYIKRMSALPKNLQEDPDVIMRETTRLYYSVNWLDPNLSYDAYKEALDVMNAAYTKAKSLSEFKFDRNVDFVQNVDSRLNIYRTKRLPPMADPTVEPPVNRKGKADESQTKQYTEWKAQAGRKAQRDELDRYLRSSQEDLDRLEENVNAQERLLNDMVRDLRNGYESSTLDVNLSGTTSGGQEYSIHFKADKRFKKEDAVQYIDNVQKNYDQVHEVVRQQEQIRHNAESARQHEEQIMQQHGTMTIDEASIFLTDEQKTRLLQRIQASGESPYFVFGHISKEEAALIKKGPDAMQRYIFEKLFDIHGQGRERSQPSLMEQYEFDEFEKLFKWLYGPQEGPAAFSEYRFLWNEWGLQQYIMQTLMYKPADLKDKLQALRMYMGADIDRNAKTPYANNAIAIYMQVLDERQMDLTDKWTASYKFLKSTVTQEDAQNLRQLLTASNPDLKLEKIESMNYDKFLVYLRQLHNEGHLPNDFYKRFGEIERQSNFNAMGTILTDADMLVYNEVHIQVTRMQQKLDSLTGKIQRAEANADEKAEADRLKQLLKVKNEQRAYLEVQDLKRRLAILENTQAQRALGDDELKEYTSLKQSIQENSLKIDFMTSMYDAEVKEENLSMTDLAIRRGYSPLEWEVRNRLKVMVEKQVGHILASDGSEEWLLRRAVISARMNMIGTGHVMTKGAINVIKPMAAKGELESINKFAGPAVMWAPFLEDVVRAINPDYFEDRFSMGGEVGARMRSIRQANLIKSKGYALAAGIQIERTVEYEAYADNHTLSPEEKYARAYIDFARHETGIQSDYMLAESWFRGGGAVDSSTWRPYAGLLEELKIHCEKQGYPHAWKNMALWFQIATIGTSTNADIIARRTLLNRSLDRTPSNFFHLLSGDIVNQIKTQHNITDLEWRSFMRALTTTETEMWQNMELASRDDISLSSDRDYGLLRENLKLYGNIADERLGIFQEVLKDMHDQVTQKRHGRQYETILDALAHHNFPVTVSLADMDWSVANFFKLGTAAMDRRGRDILAMQQAEGFLIELDTKPEFVRPHGEKGVHDWIAKLKEFEGAHNTFEGRDATEAATLELVRDVFMFNRSRVKDIKNILGWIPFSDKIMRVMAEQDPEHFPVFSWLPGWHNFLHENNLYGKKLAHWPHSVGEAVSLSVRFYGAEAEDWDIHRIDHIIDLLQHEGVFTEHPEYLNQLRREFGTTFANRLADIPRKYWWVVIGATVAVAALEAAEEEKRGGGGHH